MSKADRRLEATDIRSQHTAEVRRFNNFIEVAQRLECDETGQLFKQMLEQVVPAKRGLTSATSAGQDRSGARKAVRSQQRPSAVIRVLGQ